MAVGGVDVQLLVARSHPPSGSGLRIVSEEFTFTFTSTDRDRVRGIDGLDPVTVMMTNPMKKSLLLPRRRRRPLPWRGGAV